MKSNLEPRTREVIANLRKNVLEGWNAIDVSECLKLANGDFILTGLVEGKDYLDMDTARWIHSIGEALKPFIAEMPEGHFRIFPPGTFVASVQLTYAANNEKFRWRFRRCEKK